jgi:[acyl-carrier-protein] S-malonyltransferase
MAPVAEAVAALVASAEVVAPRVPLFDHRDGSPLRTAEEVRVRLSGQLASRLDWPGSIGRLVAEGASVFVEMPPGGTTTRMVRWIARDATAFAIDQPEDRERYLAGTAGQSAGGA